MILATVLSGQNPIHVQTVDSLDSALDWLAANIGRFSATGLTVETLDGCLLYSARI